MKNNQRVYTAGEAAERLGIPYHRLDYYERCGKIPRARRTGTNQRVYNAEEINSLMNILVRKRLITRPENK